MDRFAEQFHSAFPADLLPDFGEFVEGLAVADESSGVEWDQQIFGAQWPSDYQEVWTLYRSHELYLFYLATLISVVGF